MFPQSSFFGFKSPWQTPHSRNEKQKPGDRRASQKSKSQRKHARGRSTRPPKLRRRRRLRFWINSLRSMISSNSGRTGGKSGTDESWNNNSDAIFHSQERDMGRVTNSPVSRPGCRYCQCSAENLDPFSTRHVQAQFDEYKVDASHRIISLMDDLHAKSQEIHELHERLDKCELVIRKQQEASFKQMDSGRCIPKEESKVTGDLSRIRRDIKSWAKGTSTKDMSKIQQIGALDKNALMKSLAHVAVLDNGELSPGLSTQKSPSILLNALLAHNTYANFFSNPFFFFQCGFGQESEKITAANELSDIYRMTQQSNQEDAHMWRSQTLRLLPPPSRLGNHDGERTMRSWTENRIAEVSSLAASQFAAGPARHLIALSPDARINYRTKLESIYQEAAMIPSNLWTHL